jgi:hypothetical protein
MTLVRTTHGARLIARQPRQSRRACASRTLFLRALLGDYPRISYRSAALGRARARVATFVGTNAWDGRGASRRRHMARRAAKRPNAARTSNLPTPASSWLAANEAESAFSLQMSMALPALRSAPSRFSQAHRGGDGGFPDVALTSQLGDI